MLQRQSYIALEEESAFGVAASPRFTNPVYVQPRSFTVNFTPNILRFEPADGGRDPARRFYVSRTYDWEMTIPTHPIDNGWWWKWAGGSMLVVSAANGTYRYVLAGPGVELPSFTIYADPRIEDFVATGEQTFQLLGAKVGSLQLDFAGGDDQMATLTLTGILQRTREASEGSGVIQGLPPIQYQEQNLDLGVQWSPYYFKNFITAWAGGSYDATNNWRRGSVRIENSLIPRAYANEETNTHIDDILLGSRRVVVEFDKDTKDSSSRRNNWLAGTDQELNIRNTHKTQRGESSPTVYQEIFTFPNMGIDDGNPLYEAAGGEDISERTFRAEALRGTSRKETNPGADSASINSMDLDPVWVIGVSGDGWAWEQTVVTTGYLTRVGVPMSTDGTETAVFSMIVITDDGGSPSAPTALSGGLVLGGTSNGVKGEMLTTTKQMIYFDFPYAPKLTGAATYWFLVYATGAATTTANIFGNSTGTDSQVTTSDGGQTWSVDTNARAASDLYFDDIVMIVDQYVDDAQTYFPDAV